MNKPPLAHKIIIDKPYTPSESTDIRKTFAAARKAIAKQKVVTLPTLSIDSVKLLRVAK